MSSVVSRRSNAMGAMTKEMRELVGEHEAIKAYMQFLANSAEKLSEQSTLAKERIWNYCCCLYDFKDAIWYHLETDEKVLKSLLGDTYGKDIIEEHREIERMANEMALLANNDIITTLEQAQLKEYTFKLGSAFNRICKMVELHIAKENAILEQVLTAPNKN
jgi:hypothetical protein